MNKIENNKTQYDWFPRKSQNSRKLKKERKICNHLLNIQDKNSQKGENLVTNGQILDILEFYFPGMQSMIFSKKTIRTTFIPKIRKI